jgi:hypothetical protein
MAEIGKTGLLLAAILIATPARAQDAPAPVPPAKIDPMKFVPDPAKLTMPKLEFTPTPEDESTFDKYFYFNRADTSFEHALADLRDCDGFASGLSSGYNYQAAPYPYTNTMAGAVGGAIGNAMVAAIFGSAEKRRLRRVNMRRCMGYKGYSRYGLAKELWQEFNFEEGFSGEAEEKRQAMLAQQALVASGPKPATKELGL